MQNKINKAVMKSFWGFLAIWSFLASNNAQAALGQRAETINQDMGALSTTLHTSSSFKNFNVHEISSTGLKVREYVSKSGTIFGVAWTGNGHPDLTLLLGDYFSDYSKAIPHPAQRKFRGAQNITNAGSVIVEKSGHLRAMYGRAFVPALIPTGVTADEVK